jgi:molybdopterin converting factor small subunit
VKVTVRLFATFRDLNPTQTGALPLSIDVDEHESIRGLIRTLRLPDELPRVILVNGIFATEDSTLHEGDVVSIFPPLMGGRF